MSTPTPHTERPYAELGDNSGSGIAFLTMEALPLIMVGVNPLLLGEASAKDSLGG